MKHVAFISTAFGLLSTIVAASAVAVTEPKPVTQNYPPCTPGATWPWCPDFPGWGSPGGECCPFSDDNLKTNVIPLKTATEQLLKIKGVNFEWKSDGRKDIGVIAQDVAKVYPELTRNKDGVMQVDYQKLTAPLIESIRELNQRIAILEKAQGKAQ